MQFHVTITGSDPHGLRDLLERYAHELWIPDHYTNEEKAAFVLDQFKRSVASRLEALSVTEGAVPCER